MQKRSDAERRVLDRKIIRRILDGQSLTKISREHGVFQPTITLNVQRIAKDLRPENYKRLAALISANRAPKFSPQKAAEILVRFKKSFLDEMVDNFVEIWRQI